MIKNLLQRTLTGIVYVVVIVTAISIHPLLFAGVFALFVGLLIYELYALIKEDSPLWVRCLGITSGMYLFTASCLYAGGYTGSVIYLPYLLVLLILFVSGLYTHTGNPVRQWGNLLFAHCYIAGALSLLGFIPYLQAPVYNPLPLLVLFIFIWLNDTGAFLIGVWLGKHRLLERISPLKSWEGFFGGFAFVVIASVCFSLYFPELSLFQWLILAVVIVVSATFGDLMESLLKRTYDAKDSGKLLPGHGGMLDRFDSALLSAPAVYIFFALIMLFSCRSEQEVDYPVLSVDITRVNNPSVFDIFEKVEIIPLETTDNSLLGDIVSIDFYKDHYYIRESKAGYLFCFDENGKFVRTIGKVGQGPEEYIYVSSFTINPYNDVVEGLSPFGFLYVYDLFGKFVSKTNLPMEVPNFQTPLIPDDSIRLFNYQTSKILNDSLRILNSLVKNDEDQLYVYSIKTNTVVNSFYTESPVLDGIANRGFYQYNDSIYFFKALKSSVIKIDQYGYEVAYAWDFGKFNPEQVKLDKDITSEKLSEMVKSSQIKGVYVSQKQNDKYYYTCFVSHDPQDSEKITFVHVLYDKRDKKTYVFDKFKEYLYFGPLYWCNEYALGQSYIFSYKDIPKFIDSPVFDEENRNKLRAMKEDDNPFLLKYYFK